LGMPKRSTKRSNDPEGMRQKVLDVAASLFQSQGYNATSMKDLLRAAGVSAGAMYHHFPTKKACGLDVIRERVQPSVVATWIEPIAKSFSARIGIRDVMTAIAEELEQAQRVRGCPLNNLTLELALADPEYRAAISSIFREWQRVIAEKIKSDIVAGKLQRIDAESFATFVVAAYSGAMAIAKAEQNVRALIQCRDEITASLARFETRQ
jgi:TetR/AcrR family transcriptional regulator, transcriptional repressor for nem operon